MGESQSKKNRIFENGIKSRDGILLALLGLFLVAIIARLFYVQVVAGGDYADKAATAHTNKITLEAKRGTIYDRNGVVIASDVDATTIYADPQQITEFDGVAQTLADVLGPTTNKTKDDYYKLIDQPDLSFVYILRKADADLASSLKDTLKSQKLDGIHYLSDTKRVYPNGDVGSQLVGNVDVDGNGIAGLELEYNDLVGGTDGVLETERGSKGLPIPDGEISRTDAVDGKDIVTSIDINLQKKAEEALLPVVQEYNAQGGSVTVMDASTGEIYASCSYAKKTSSSSGDSDSDSGSKSKYSLEVGKLWSATDSYEPGSTFKALTATSILTNNADVNTNTTFTVPGALQVYDATIKDSHEHGTETLSLNDIIAQSSNIGTVLASRTVSSDQLYNTYKTFGIGQNPGTDFPGTASGSIKDASSWDPVTAANITFGQGVSVTGMQIVRAYGALEQRGTMHTPHFLMSIPNDQAKTDELTSPLNTSDNVADANVCNEVVSMMKSVVTDGTGKDAAVDGFTVAGKTGTAEVAKSSGGYGNGYIVSFGGWLEGSSSNLVCLVTVQQPHTEAGGGEVCGPVFADIMSFAAERYHIAAQAN